MADNSSDQKQVLPTNVKPVHYNLTLQPNLETFVFYGHVTVDLVVQQDTKEITLNAHDIKIKSAILTAVSLKTESKQKAKTIAYDEKKDLAILTFEESIPAQNKAVLEMVFEGTLNDQMAGFYRSTYKDANGETKYLATTQFEATDARRAFPCWDEPALKATFDVSLIVPENLTALSNMNVISEKPYFDSGKGTAFGKHEGAAGKHEGTTGKHEGATGKHEGVTGKHEGATGKHEGATGKHEGATGKHEGARGKHEGATGKHEGATGKHEGATGKHEGATGKHEGATGKHESAVGKTKLVKFATTPLMSTYLLAFVIGPFEFIEAFTSGEHNGHPICCRVYALPGSVEQGRHALSVCTKALEYFAKVFGEPYPLPKVDMVAIPDFEAGAMENWGLITYRTVALLFDEKSSSITFKKSTAYTVCHELAHQWFGNLVTMEWWEHLWLNEGFATWVGWLAVDHIYPEWDVWTSFINEDMPRALNLDALRSSHPIEVAVNDPAEIHQIFDAISYYKGASVIRMLSSWLGVDVFLAGVRRYLRKYKYGNASTNDLWAALSEEAGVDVSRFMTLWTKSVGYPVLKVEETDAKTIKVTQSRYLSTGDLKESEDSTVWWAPLGILTSTGIESHTLVEKTQTFTIPSDGLFKLNAGHTSVYRVNYPITIIQRLASEIKKGPDGLLGNNADRVGLIVDAGNLCVSGEQSTADFLELAQAFVNETNFFVWSQLSGHLSNILQVWAKEPEAINDGLKALRRSLFAPLVRNLGWEFDPNEDYLTNTLRVLAVSNAGRSNDAETVAEAKKRFWAFANGDADALHPNLRGPVYGIVLLMAENDEEELKAWEQILAIYKDKSLPTDQQLIALNALGGAKNPEIINRYLRMTLDENQVRGQDSPYVFRSLSINPDARDILWTFFSENFSLLHSKFSKSLSLFGSAVRSVVGAFTDLDKIEQVEAFFKDKDTKEYARPLQQALEGAKVNAKWLSRDRGLVSDWVQQYKGQIAA